jgi:Domain of unknown function (DUF4397)
MRLITSKSGIRNVLVACALSAGLLMNVAAASPALAGTGLAGAGLAGAGLAGSGLAGSGLAGSGLAGAGLAHARAGDSGWLRLAHLSPNTPAVDVYLYSFGNSRAEVVLHHVSYGTVSPYLRAPAGTYTVAMRAAGAAPTSAPVLSTAVHVQAGDAYTVAGMGPKDGLRLVVLRDDLTAPAGKSMVQVIQASMREHQVTVRASAHVFGRNLAFATSTGFQALANGSYLVRASGQTESAEQRIELDSGSIHTLVILDTPRRLKIVDLTDAVGSQVVPGTAPATGFGGTAPVAGPPSLPWVAVISSGLLFLAVGLVSLRRSRRLAGARRA